MANFPLISNITDLQNVLDTKEEIRLSENQNRTKTVCYMVSDNDTFNSPEAKECRGITFDSTGKIICRPLHKFFNLNENEEVLYNKIDWTLVSQSMDKVDGSMITPARVNGQIDWKTKKSFTSDVAIMAKKFLAAKKENITQFVDKIVDNYTPIFEYISPQARIVIGYPEEDVILLHVRHIQTGEYQNLNTPKWRELIKEHNIKTAKQETTNIDYILGTISTEKNKEGYVIQFNNGNMIKVKTDWYRKLHHVVTFLRKRDIAELALSEQLDDVKSAMLEAGHPLEAINKIEHQVMTRILDLTKELDVLWEANKTFDRKTIAINNKENYLFPLLMDKFSNKEPNIKEFYTRKYLKQEFGLEVIEEQDTENISIVAKSKKIGP